MQHVVPCVNVGVIQVTRLTHWGLNKNNHHFDIFKRFSPRFVVNGPVDSDSSLLWVMAQRLKRTQVIHRTSDEYIYDAVCHQAPLS